MRIFCSLVLVVSSVLMIGCAGEPTVDGSSVEAFESSLEIMKENMTESERDELAQALLTIALDLADLEAVLSGTSDESLENLDTRAMEKVDGKTASEIIAMAEEIRDQ